MNRKAELLWTPEGTWLQVVDEEGCLRISDLGKLSRFSVELFAHDHGIEFCEVRCAAGVRVSAGGRVIA